MRIYLFPSQCTIVPQSSADLSIGSRPMRCVTPCGASSTKETRHTSQSAPPDLPVLPAVNLYAQSPISFHILQSTGQPCSFVYYQSASPLTACTRTYHHEQKDDTSATTHLFIFSHTQQHSSTRVLIIPSTSHNVSHPSVASQQAAG